MTSTISDKITPSSGDPNAIGWPESPQTNPKTCVTCKHLLGKRQNTEDWNTKWACHHPNNIASTSIHEVTGLPIILLKVIPIGPLRGYHSTDCPNPRVTCGGDWWEEYVYVPYTLPSIGGDVGTELETGEKFTPDALSAGREAAKARFEAIKKRKLTNTDLNNL